MNWHHLNHVERGRSTYALIVGNGNNSAAKSDAFIVSYDGHTAVFDKNGTGIMPGGRSAFLGSTYQDNVIYAWGDITGSNTGPCLGTITNNGDFGVFSFTYICKGQYRVTLNTADAFGTTFTAWSALSVTATPETMTPTSAASCAIAVVSPLNAGGISNAFDIFLLDPSNSCAPIDGRVSFHVCGRK